MPRLRLTIALLTLGLAIFAGAFAVGRSSRQAATSGAAAGAPQAHLTPLPAAPTPPSVPRLTTVAALPALRVHHATKKRLSVAGVSPTTSTGSSTSTGSTAATGPSTGSTTPPSTLKQPTAKKPSGDANSVSSGGDSLGG